jgi:single-strand DNA-binding protein
VKLGSDYIRQAEKDVFGGSESLNRVLLRGELGRDPDFKRLPNGSSVCNFVVVTTDKWTDKAGQSHTKSEWHKVTAWNQDAETAGGLSKGERVYLEGRIQTRNWDDDSGHRRTRTEIIADKVRPLREGAA